MSQLLGTQLALQVNQGWFIAPRSTFIYMSLPSDNSLVCVAAW